MFVQLSPSGLRDNVHTQNLVGNQCPAYLSARGELRDRPDSLVQRSTTQNAQAGHFGLGQQHLAGNTIAIAFNLSVSIPATHARRAKPQMRQLM